MTNDEEIKRGRDARQLLEHPLINEAFETIENEVMTAWQKTLVAESDKREQLYMMQALLRRVKLHLTSVVETGQLAAATAQSQSNRAAGKTTILD